MTEWRVLRQGDDGNQALVGVHADRVEALASVLALESGYPHKQLYWVEGPATPACADVDALLDRLADVGEALQNERTLLELLLGLWLVSRTMAHAEPHEPDAVAALFTAAGKVDVPRFEQRWRAADLSYERPDPVGYDGFERVLLSQIVDLDQFAANPPGKYAGLGVSIQRSPGTGARSTPRSWHNFEPAGYLDCASSGYGSVRLSPAQLTMDWTELAEYLLLGQLYE